MPVELHDLTSLQVVSEAILKSDAEDALTREVFNSSGEFVEDAVRGIGVASGRIKDYLQRNLIAQEYSILLKPTDWEKKERVPQSNYDNRLMYSRLRDWPILHAEEDVMIRKDREIFAKDDQISELNIIAGYKRKDQTLSDFGSSIQNKLNNASDIPTLPSVIVDVANNIAIHNAVVRISGLIGKEVSEQQIGDFSTTVRRETERESYEKEQFRRLATHRMYT